MSSQYGELQDQATTLANLSISINAIAASLATADYDLDDGQVRFTFRKPNESLQRNLMFKLIPDSMHWNECNEQTERYLCMCGLGG